ncbi:DUF2073 domain-containing protein [Methanonatronarchaeum sp. AMET-Sl]|uniref:DUF2073 domain-containing protein n=1 Tax=Methanonatronarchaeum sp. AMET-Sl TaxID=3037654 RepID=UPI00244E4D9E|nr:DUF2073 domain-containing protein [Methanonatronarchaeum sp. AMET-Sl]WGI17043.1 DUF2073 domain-containing protein [Methanonatronarchaeum sp. AMET-Sl]
MNGIQITLVSGEKVSSLTMNEKLRFIIDKVREGQILILEKGLDPEEEAELIQRTMTEIDPEEFNGIEIESYPGDSSKLSFFDKLLGKKITRLTVIGPADQVRTIKKNKDTIQALLTLKKTN